MSIVPPRVKVRYGIHWGHTYAHVMERTARTDHAYDVRSLCRKIRGYVVVGTDCTKGWPQEPNWDLDVPSVEDGACPVCASRWLATDGPVR